MEYTFQTGKTYLTQDGTPVTIIARYTTPNGSCVLGSDDLWRYDRESGCGRVTGTNHDYSHPKNFQRSYDGNNFYEVDMTETKEEDSMSFTENDYNLLRPFDLEAAKAGQAICTRDGREARFVAHMPECGVSNKIVVVNNEIPYFYYEDGTFHPNCKTDNDLRMAPLFWLEGKPVYKGDKLWHNFLSLEITADRMSLDKESLFSSDNKSYLLKYKKLSWPPVEEWVAFDPNTVKIGDKVSVAGYGKGVVVLGPNQRGEFVFDIVDCGYLVADGAYDFEYSDVTVMKTL